MMQADDTGSASFFGFLGVACALVFASKAGVTQTWARPTGRLRAVLVSRAWEC